MRRSTGRDLRADEGGAILVTAIVMGAVLAAAVLYVLQLGDTIFVRERLQDAADATAFQGAVWHARGMNATAVLNVLMSAALAVIATIRQVELVCLAIPGAQSCARAAYDLEKKFDDPVKISLNVLKYLQTMVAIQTPVFAMSVAGNAPGEFDDQGDPSMKGSLHSLALMPMAVDKLFDVMPGVTEAIPERMPLEVLGPAAVIFPSLPVQQGKFSQLCEKAATFLINQINTALERLKDYIGGLDFVVDLLFGNWFMRQIAEPAVGWVARNFSGMMCKPTEEMLDQAIADVAGQNCQGRKREREQEIADAIEWNRTHPPEDQKRVPPRWSALDQQRCMRRETDEAERNQRVLTFDVPPAVVYGPAKNGSPFLHVWSKVEQDIPEDEQDEDQEPRKAVAEAEYYFDCEDAWSGCKDSALWRPGWTARMRRYRGAWLELDMGGFVYNGITGVLQARASEFIDAHLESAIEDALAGTVCHATSRAASSTCESFANEALDHPLAKWVTEKAADFVGRVFTTGASAAHGTIGDGGRSIIMHGVDTLLSDGFRLGRDFAEDLGLQVPSTLGYHHDRRIH